VENKRGPKDEPRKVIPNLESGGGLLVGSPHPSIKKEKFIPLYKKEKKFHKKTPRGYLRADVNY